MSSYLEWKKRAIVMGSGGWWLPPNFDPDDCLAAYQFKGAGSESAALTDLTGHGKTLTRTGDNSAITFKNNVGFVWNEVSGAQYLHNTEIVNNINSFVIRYKIDYLGQGYGICFRTGFAVFDGVTALSVWHNHWITWQDESYREAVYLTRKSPSWWQDLSGVVGYNIGWSSETNPGTHGDLYLDGALVAESNRQTFNNHYTGNEVLFGQGFSGFNSGRYTMVAGAFYRRNLRADEMSYLYYQIAAI